MIGVRHLGLFVYIALYETCSEARVWKQIISTIAFYKVKGT